MTSAQRHNKRQDAIWERCKAAKASQAGERTQHTPGPWRFNPATHEIESLENRVATISNEGKGIPQDAEGEANASLIAAAPETAAERDKLREQVKDLLAACEQHGTQ